MTELTFNQMKQIREALILAMELAEECKRTGKDLTEIIAAERVIRKAMGVNEVGEPIEAAPAAKVETAPVAAKAKTFGTVFKIGGGYLAKWFDGNEFQSRRDFATRKEANNFLRSLNAEILSAADYEFPARAARRQVWEQRKTVK